MTRPDGQARATYASWPAVRQLFVLPNEAMVAARKPECHKCQSRWILMDSPIRLGPAMSDQLP
jgi:hypothetical protein